MINRKLIYPKMFRVDLTHFLHRQFRAKLTINIDRNMLDDCVDKYYYKSGYYSMLYHQIQSTLDEQLYYEL